VDNVHTNFLSDNSGILLIGLKYKHRILNSAIWFVWLA